MFIFQKYKCVSQEKYESKMKKLGNSNIILYGANNVGKKTLVDSLYKHAKYIEINENVSETLEKMNMSYDVSSKVAVIKSEIHRKKQKVISSLIDKCPAVKFIIICKRIDSIIAELDSRCVRVHLSLPDKNEKKRIIQRISEKEEITFSEENCEVICNFSETTHDVLINMELMRNSIHPKENAIWKEFAEEMCMKLTKLSGTDIRGKVYKLFANTVDMNQLLHHLLNTLINMVDSVNTKCHLVNECAKYQHNLQIGNKDVYHVEAFLFTAKNILMDNDVSNVFANKITIVS